MNLSDFDYSLPKELIAKYPQKKRDQCRLMVIDRAADKIEHRYFKDILEYLKPEDLLVLNDTKVIPARLLGRKETGGKVDVLLLEKKSSTDFKVLLKPSRLKINEKIIFDGGSLKATLIDQGLLRFNTSNSEYIYSKGLMPLPPYIKRLPKKKDETDYQTVYARRPGAIASPTAGLHFSEEILSRIKQMQVSLAYVTLHINYATFKPVKEDNILEHKMYKEYYQVERKTLDLINRTKGRSKKIIAVGTTSCRVLETVAQVNQLKGWTDLYIYPGHQFKSMDCLLTNFHLPRTSLLILVAAFIGSGLLHRAYQEAIEKRYRFYSYGDAMLII